jgi:hypothetical protein
MDHHFIPVPFDDIRDDVRRHLATLPGTIDSFLEDHILASAHYRIAVAGESAGFASIHQERLITQFALAEPYRRYGQPIFGQLRKSEQVQSAFVPTCDEYYLAHALDDYRQLNKQAYFFATIEVAAQSREPNAFSLRQVVPEDAPLILQHSGDFFDQLERRIDANELFITLRDGDPVGFGIAARSSLYADVASIGMFTLERHRRAGVGTATIALLSEECQRQGLRPIAGC